jgi:hypothetical protein
VHGKLASIQAHSTLPLWLKNKIRTGGTLRPQQGGLPPRGMLGQVRRPLQCGTSTLADFWNPRPEPKVCWQLATRSGRKSEITWPAPLTSWARDRRARRSNAPQASLYAGMR